MPCFEFREEQAKAVIATTLRQGGGQRILDLQTACLRLILKGRAVGIGRKMSEASAWHQNPRALS